MISIRKMLATLSLAAVAGFTVDTASAVAILDFDQLGAPGGTITYDGIGGGVVGTGIRFTGANISGAPAGNGGYTCVGNGTASGDCELSFTTGGNLTEGAISTFAGGGTFTLTGELVGITGAGVDVTLLTGAFTGPNFSVVGGGFLNFTGFGQDTKHPDIISFLGLSVDEFKFSNTEISSTNVVTMPNGGFSADVTTADLVNTNVPEPTTMVLLGTALLGLGLRRRFKK